MYLANASVSRTRPVEELTPERLATNFTNYSKEFRGIRVIRGQAFSEFVAICGGGNKHSWAFHIPQKLHPVLALMNFGCRIYGHMYLGLAQK